ncbi:heavy metal-associated isoprenylated plant protein 7-like [Senna tora]|uniref:Heavy metal-associated isoprenylated plant protein 7-like n=1 Tax=Senna tora TaxID=362788 RepID=A0A834X908_9FABA|nr:heavy metal-associated isoprenylated plant protein 7-like [Senna tora]
MHCEACARKVARALKGFEGVEEVSADSKGGKVVVKGKGADPIKVFERLQKKSGRKVELISPLPKPPAEKKEEESKDQSQQPLQQPKKEEGGGVVTVILKVGMHCEACAQVIQKRIRKIKGVESVETDLGNDKVTVKGVIDPTKLVEYVYKRTGKQASIVKEEEQEKKKEEEDDEEKKKQKEKLEGDEKKGEENEEIKKGEEEEEDDDDQSDIIKKMEYWPSKYFTEYAYAPQIFSDDNPNACSLM